MSTLPSPAMAVSTGSSSSSSSHSKGSFGPVFIVLAVITVVAVFACFLGRLFARRYFRQKGQKAHNSQPKDDMEGGFEMNFPRSKPAINGVGMGDAKHATIGGIHGAKHVEKMGGIHGSKHVEKMGGIHGNKHAEMGGIHGGTRVAGTGGSEGGEAKHSKNGDFYKAGA